MPSKALCSGRSEFQPRAHLSWQGLTSPAAPMAQTRAVTLVTATRASENKRVT